MFKCDRIIVTFTTLNNVLVYGLKNGCDICWKELHNDKTTGCILTNERRNVTELRVICTIGGEWGKLVSQPPGLIPVCWKQLCKDETVVLKCVIMRG